MKHLKILSLIVGIFTIIMVLIAFAVSNPFNDQVINKESNVVNETSNDTKDFSKKKKINDEYLGELYFDSDLISESFTQTDNNDKYLTKTWDLKDSENGSVFLDTRNSLDDQNLVFYGSLVENDDSLMFSPLHMLKKQSKYEDNKNITLELAKETRKYVITNVFYYEMNDDNLKYFFTNYNSDNFDGHTFANEEYFNQYITAVKEIEFYDTNETLGINDKWITLQTGVKNRDDLRLIVIAKEVEVIKK
ncbi:MAG: class B sortase [Anaerorhabdus sp.]